jgi:hypothetical protein
MLQLRAKSLPLPYPKAVFSESNILPPLLSPPDGSIHLRNFDKKMTVMSRFLVETAVCCLKAASQYPVFMCCYTKQHKFYTKIIYSKNPP